MSAEARQMNCRATNPEFICVYTFVDWVNFAELQPVRIIDPDVLHVIW